MKLAVNFSESLLLLLQENPQLPVEYIKLPTIPFPGGWTQFIQGRQYRKLLPHLAQSGIIDLCHPQIKQSFNDSLVTKIISQTAPPHLSTHLEASLGHFPEIKDYLHYNHPVVVKELRNRLIPNILMTQKKIGIPLLLENNPYYSWSWHYRVSCEPEFITGICESGDCGLLLDIAHARISAAYFQIDIEDYLLRLPLSRVREIHMSGVLEAPVGIWDSHTILHECDYRLLEYILNRTKPEIVTIEYGGYDNREWNPLDGCYVECFRNNPTELREMIYKVGALINCPN